MTVIDYILHTTKLETFELETLNVNILLSVTVIHLRTPFLYQLDLIEVVPQKTRK